MATTYAARLHLKANGSGDEHRALLLRERTPVDLMASLAPRPAPEAAPFVSAEPPDLLFANHEASRAAHPWWPAVLPLLALPAAFGLDGTARIATAIGSVVLAEIVAIRQYRARNALERRLNEEAATAHASAEEARRRAHDEAHAARLAEHATAEAERAALRDALARGDAARIVPLLEQALGAQSWPTDIEVALAFDGLSTLELELELDPADAETRCSLALRLVHEAFRLLPSLARVRLRGATIDAGTLVLDLDRKTFTRVDLDKLDATRVVNILGRWETAATHEA